MTTTTSEVAEVVELDFGIGEAELADLRVKSEIHGAFCEGGPEGDMG